MSLVLNGAEGCDMMCRLGEWLDSEEADAGSVCHILVLGYVHLAQLFIAHPKL
jgi:hypothetical protein